LQKLASSLATLQMWVLLNCHGSETEPGMVVPAVTHKVNGMFGHLRGKENS